MPFQPPSTKRRVEFNLKGRTLQVIVKLTNIVLTQRSPRILVAHGTSNAQRAHRHQQASTTTYARENITESFSQVGVDVQAALRTLRHGLRGWRQQLWLPVDLRVREAAEHQELGHIIAVEDKCVAFPDLWQHRYRVQPFELADPSKPGVRNFLCFFLVDPFQGPALRELATELYDMIASYA